jgi:hypothetical protein
MALRKAEIEYMRTPLLEGLIYTGTCWVAEHYDGAPHISASFNAR